MRSAAHETHGRGSDGSAGQPRTENEINPRYIRYHHHRPCAARSASTTNESEGRHRPPPRRPPGPSRRREELTPLVPRHPGRPGRARVESQNKKRVPEIPFDRREGGNGDLGALHRRGRGFVAPAASVSRGAVFSSPCLVFSSSRSRFVAYFRACFRSAWMLADTDFQEYFNFPIGR